MPPGPPSAPAPHAADTLPPPPPPPPPPATALAAAHLGAASRRAPLALAGVVLAGCAVVAVADPNTTLYPPCPFRAVTGLDCPGCGGLRATRALLGGDVALAADHNLLLVVVLPLLVAAWAWWLARAWATRPAVAPRWVWAAAGVVTVAFWVGRNLPGAEALRSFA